jgi:hypothetical protein
MEINCILSFLKYSFLSYGTSWSTRNFEFKTLFSKYIISSFDKVFWIGTTLLEEGRGFEGF